MKPRDHDGILHDLEATCGCTNAARTAAEAMRNLLDDHATMVQALRDIVATRYDGEPDVTMRRIARVALATVEATA